MKRVIQAKTYDTDTAGKLFEYTQDDEVEGTHETLYLSPKGQLFLVVEYTGLLGKESTLELKSDDEAQEWLESAGATDPGIYAKIDVEIDEG